MRRRSAFLVVAVVVLAVVLAARAIDWQWRSGPAWQIAVGRRCWDFSVYFYHPYCTYEYRLGLVMFLGQRICSAASIEMRGFARTKIACLDLRRWLSQWITDAKLD